MPMTSKIRRQGGSAVVTIPPALLKALGLNVGDEITLSIESGRLVAQRAARKRYSLAELLKGSTDIKRLTAEIAWVTEGDLVGREIV